MSAESVGGEAIHPFNDAYQRAEPETVKRVLYRVNAWISDVTVLAILAFAAVANHYYAHVVFVRPQNEQASCAMAEVAKAAAPNTSKPGEPAHLLPTAAGKKLYFPSQSVPSLPP